MNGDPRTEAVTARIIFKGVMLACINRKGQYEVGMVRCPNHEPKITITQNEGGSATVYEPTWPQGHDLLFKVNNPGVNGVSRHPTTNMSMRFDRVIDMEGFLFHRGRVTVHPEPLQGRRLAVTAGTLFTDTLSTKEFDLVTWTNDSDPGTIRGHIGKIAQWVGLNIQCGNEAGSGIQLIDIETNGEIFPMPALNGRTYAMEIDNDCTKNGGSPAEIGSDFRYFYRQGFVTSSDGLMFDLDYDKTPGPGGAPAPSPDACENTFLSLTDTLGIRS
jgi:hypothetical protein